MVDRRIRRGVRDKRRRATKEGRVRSKKRELQKVIYYDIEMYA